jgi:broad specificity phosphatase PhoE
MPIFLLIRHGENDFIKQARLPGRLPDIHLNKRGRDQAKALSEKFRNYPIRAIYSSPLERAVETAEPLARSLDLPIQLRPALMDIDVGEWAGIQISKLRKLPLWKLVQEQPSQARFPGGESFLELQEHLVSEIETILGAHKNRDILAVVFHSDPIKLVLAHYLGLPLDNFQKLTVAAGSVSILVLGKSGVRLTGLNLNTPFILNK